MHLTLLLRAPQMTLLFRFNFVLNYVNDYLWRSLILKANGPPLPPYTLDAFLTAGAWEVIVIVHLP